MGYFNHAYQKTIYGGGVGYINSAGEESVTLKGTYGVGAFTFADQDASGWPSVNVAPIDGSPLTLLSTSLYQNDKVGPLHGGYHETSKSKMINPRYITEFYKVESAVPVTHIIGVGATPNLDLNTQACCPEFYCDETYNLRLDLKGSPALRFLNHNVYENLSAYTGCCEGPVPTLVDPMVVMGEWVKYITLDPILFGASYAPGFTPQTGQRLVNVGATNTCDDGATWDFYLPDNLQTGLAGVYFEVDNVTLNATGIAFVASVEASQQDANPGFAFASVEPLSAYVSAFTPAAPNCCSGIVIESAFVETKFGDCTFETSDHFEIEPLLIQASLIDETGDPCVFDQLCISDGITPSGAGSQEVLPAIQFGKQAMGTGESVLRDLIMSERYAQNPFNSNDYRVREITQGYDISSAVDRNALYTCYFIKHSVPRHNNPSGTFDNDQYLISIPMTAEDTDFEAFVAAWLAGVNSNVTMKTL